MFCLVMVRLSTPNPSFPVHNDSLSSATEPSKPVLNLNLKSIVFGPRTQIESSKALVSKVVPAVEGVESVYSVVV